MGMKNVAKPENREARAGKQVVMKEEVSPLQPGGLSRNRTATLCQVAARLGNHICSYG